MDVDPDSGRNRDRAAVDEHIEMRMDMQEEELVRFRCQARLLRQLHRICGRRPGSRILRRRRGGPGLHRDLLSASAATCQREHEQTYAPASHPRHPIRGTLVGSREEDEMTELATPPVQREEDVKRISHWIGGRLVEGGSGRSGPVYNPALGQQTGAVDFATPEEVDSAVQAAKEAFESWRAMSLSKRTAILFQIRELVHERQEEIARILTAEHGKVLSTRWGRLRAGSR